MAPGRWISALRGSQQQTLTLHDVRRSFLLLRAAPADAILPGTGRVPSWASQGYELPELPLAVVLASGMFAQGVVGGTALLGLRHESRAGLKRHPLRPSSARRRGKGVVVRTDRPGGSLSTSITEEQRESG